MKKFLLGTLGLVAMAAPALAADLPVKAPPPVLPPMYNWSGFYIGGNAGWGESDDCWIVATLAGPFADGCRQRSGGVAGGQFGYRWQLPNNHFVFGLEAQGDWANLRSSRVSLLDPTLTFGTKLDGIGLFTGSVGFAWDTWLVYMKAGWAVTGGTFTVSDTATGVGLASASSSRWGGAVGVGFEYGFTPNWSVGIEYDHLAMGGSDFVFATPAFPAINGLTNRITQDVNMVTVRFNYRFGGYGYGGPLVAHY
jgi:outer membrane immunogenic protein